ncbi:MAG: SDR family oxidoreductase [Caulobacteraceae bacterium]|nr:SDR family oxidoreductase [Caulobacteraceae bacterium]
MSMPRTAGRLALVTGGARRIGRTLVLALAQTGLDVAVHYRTSKSDAEAVCAEAEVFGVRAQCFQADLAVEGKAAALLERARDAMGPVSVLINNASVFQEDSVRSMTRASWDAHMETNLRSPLALAQAFAAQAPDGSVIINLLDQRVWKPNPQFFTYALSKAALWAATRTLAQALAPRIRVNAVGPGPTLPSIHQAPEDFAAEAANVPLGRRATPEEIARAVLYLVDAPSVTGQMIAVDGGQHLAWRTPDIAPETLGES